MFGPILTENEPRGVRLIFGMFSFTINLSEIHANEMSINFCGVKTLIKWSKHNLVNNKMIKTQMNFLVGPLWVRAHIIA